MLYTDVYMVFNEQQVLWSLLFSFFLLFSFIFLIGPYYLCPVLLCPIFLPSSYLFDWTWVLSLAGNRRVLACYHPLEWTITPSFFLMRSFNILLFLHLPASFPKVCRQLVLLRYLAFYQNLFKLVLGSKNTTGEGWVLTQLHTRDFLRKLAKNSIML